MGKAADKQQLILEYIEKYTREHRYPPSVREIGTAVGLKSPSTVHIHLKSLAARGLLTKDPNKTRALALPGFSPDNLGVPILGKVTAGAPIFAFEDTRGSLNYRPRGEGEFFALEVKGDSMSGVGIIEGDYVVVRRQPNARSGQIVLALIGDEATVKRLIRSDGEIWLMPENPRYEPIDGGNCQIMGVVMSVIRENIR